MENSLTNIRENDAQARQFNQLFHEYKIIDDDLLDQELHRYEEDVLGVTISQQNFNKNASNIKMSQHQNKEINNNSGVSQSQRLASLL